MSVIFVSLNSNFYHKNKKKSSGNLIIVINHSFSLINEGLKKKNYLLYRQ